MPTALPPIPQDQFDQHNQDQFAQTAAAHAAQVDAARQQQDQAAQQEFARTADAQRGAIRDQQATADARRAFYDTADQHAAAVASARAPVAPAASQPEAVGATGVGADPLQRVYADARAAGLDDAGARAAVAVAATEGGMGGTQGDVAKGGSRGTFQLFFGGGMGNEYARSRGISEQQADAELAADPHSANRWALAGYLGQAIKQGQAQGLTGADLASYAQRVGQRSVDPERAGANYQAAQDALGASPGGGTPTESVLGSAPAPGAESTQFQGQRTPVRAEAVGQFEQGLPYEEAAAICGPVAALAFAQANGRNPDLGEARRLARARGWTPEGGMNGVANEQALLSDLGVASRLDANPDFGEVAHDAASGNPVIVSTPRHYYYVNGYDAATGRLRVGKTGEARRGGSAWMSAQEIADLDGGINGVLYVDNPRSPTPSVAADNGVSTAGDRPPSAFEQPAPPFRDKSFTGVPEAVVEEDQAEQEPLTPNRPPFGLEGLANLGGPFGARVPYLPPNVSPNVAPPSRREQERVQRGEVPATGEDIVGRGAGTLQRITSGEEPLDFSNPGAAVQSIVKVVGAALDGGLLGQFLTRQGQSEPGVLAEMLRPGAAAEAEATTAAQEARGGTGGGRVGGAVSAAGLGEDVPGPGDFAAWMQRKKDEAAGKPTKPAQRSPMGMRAQEEAARQRALEEGFLVSDEEAARARATEPGLFSEEAPATAADVAALRSRIPVWAQPPPEAGAAPALRAVEGGRPGEGLAQTVETAGRATPQRVVTDVGAQRAPIEVTPPGVATERGLARPTTTRAQQLEDAADRLVREAYDRNHALREVDALVGNDRLTGAHAAAQIVPGAVAAGEDLVRTRVLPVLDRLGSDVPVLERLWFLKSAEDLAARSPGVRLPGGVNGAAGVQQELKALVSRYGPERVARADAAMRELNALNDELRLRPLLDAGLISPAQYRDYRVNNPHYLPFHRYDYAGEGVGHLLPPRGPASASAVDLGKRSLVGSTRPLDDPVARWMADLIDTQKRVFQNRASREMVDGLVAADRQGAGHDVLVGTREALERAGRGAETRERGVVRFYDPAQPGVEQLADVPKVFADIAKGSEAEPSSLFLRIASALAMPLRAGATAYNLAFLPRNILRDAQSAYVKEGIKLWSPEMLAGWKAAIAKNADFSEAAASGALGGGLLESRRTQDVLARARSLRGGIEVRDARDAVLLLPRLLGKATAPVMRANEIAEQAPRLATFLKARAEGATTREAAVRARDVTVDFSKSGNFVKMMNQMVPFLNARVQGTANTLRLARDNKAQFAARAAAPAAVLSTAAYLWNKRYDSSASIPDSEWDRNWVFQFGEAEEAPDPRMPDAPPQKIPLYVKIPKGDAGALVSAPIEAMLRLADARNDRSAAELFLHAGAAATRGLSPVEPNVPGLAAALTPPLAATASAIQANYDPFRQRPIVPQGEAGRPAEEQFGPETSETAVALGRQFGVSPRMIEYAIRNYTGGAGAQGLWALDLGLGALGYHPEVPGEARRQATTLAQEAARAPGVSGLVGALNVGPQQLGRAHFEAAVTETQRAFYDLPDTRRLGLNFGPVADAVENVVLEPAERVDYQRRALEYATDNLDRVQNRASYENADDAGKRKLAADAIEAGRRRAAQEILKEIPSGDRRERRRIP